MKGERSGQNDWKRQHATEAEKALVEPLVKDVMEELVENLARNYGARSALIEYGIAKVAMYAASVARAQALGFDPELLRMAEDEADAALMEKARMAVALGKPVLKIDNAGVNVASSQTVTVHYRDALDLGLGISYEGQPLDPAKVTLHYPQGQAPERQSVPVTVWIGLTLHATDSIQKVEPYEIRVFATELAAQEWMRALPVRSTGPMRYIYERQLEALPAHKRAPRYPKWRIEAHKRAQEDEARARREAYAIKRAAERQAGER